MTPDQLTVLRNELADDPLGVGYGQHLPNAPGIAVDLINAPTQSMVKSRYVTTRTIMAECNDGAAILDALDAASANVSSVKWMMTFLQQDSGMDAGHPKTQAAIDQLAQAGALLPALADELKAIAIQPASRAEVLELPRISIHDLIDAGVIQ